jgi:hypothetical protein
VALVASAVAVDPAPAPFRPGLLSRGLAWVSTLPGHGWWAFPLLAVLLFSWSHVILWATGLRPFGTIDSALATAVFYGPFVLASLTYINRSAVRALAQFWPATGWPERDQTAWRYAFVNSPSGIGLLSLVVGIVASIGAFGPIAAVALGPTGDRTAYLAAYFPSALAGYGLVGVSAVHIGRQLRLVARIHREATHIDPFDRGPIYAFSNLTVRAGIAFVLLATYAMTVQGALQADNVVSLVVTSFTLVVGVICFVLPLWGIHERLGIEKDALLRDVEVRVSRLGEEMYRRIDAGQFDATKVVSDALAGVNALRDRISRLPTWPWPPNVLRGFMSALLIPVLVYIASRLIGGRVGV